MNERKVLTPDVLDLLSKEAEDRKVRADTSLGSWHDRSPKGKAMLEREVAREVFGLLSERGETFALDEDYEPDNEWPDCVAAGPNGARVAVEVTKLTDKSALEARAKDTRSGTRRALLEYQGDWDEQRLAVELQSILDKKSGRVRPGFETNLLLIDCDEAGLDDAGATERLSSCRLRFGSIGRAFVLLRRDHRLVELVRTSASE